MKWGLSLAVQWLRIHASTTEVETGQETKILHAMWHVQK